MEVDADNSGGRLKPGAYVQIHLKLPEDSRSLTGPSNALIFRRAGLEVAVVHNGKAELVPVTPGHDYGDSLERLAGQLLQDDDILTPCDFFVCGPPGLCGKARS